ncbi:uncharacterized protein LOC111388596, partial [Olea europaea var. sylvestris]|uniref:uncharacterized protein LOC111388596 n=1 Tax=Olea europaea var. sylvestris TaxID=158386 RepID=UPI000C1D7DEE
MAVKVMDSEEIEAITTRSGVKLPKITVERRVTENKKFAKFLDTFRKLHVNIPLIEALSQVPNYAKILKEILSKKKRLTDFETIKKLGLEELKDKSISLQLADRSIKYPRGVVENVLIKVGKFIFPVDFVVLDIEESWDAALLILGRSFLSTSQAVMDFESGELTLRVKDKQEKFKIYNIIENPLQEEISKKAKEECKYIVVKVQQGSRETEPKHLVSVGREKNGGFK